MVEVLPISEWVSAWIESLDWRWRFVGERPGYLWCEFREEYVPLGANSGPDTEGDPFAAPVWRRLIHQSALVELTLPRELRPHALAFYELPGRDPHVCIHAVAGYRVEDPGSTDMVALAPPRAWEPLPEGTGGPCVPWLELRVRFAVVPGASLLLQHVSWEGATAWAEVLLTASTPRFQTRIQWEDEWVPARDVQLAHRALSDLFGARKAHGGQPSALGGLEWPDAYTYLLALHRRYHREGLRWPTRDACAQELGVGKTAFLDYLAKHGQRWAKLRRGLQTQIIRSAPLDY